MLSRIVELPRFRLVGTSMLLVFPRHNQKPLAGRRQLQRNVGQRLSPTQPSTIVHRPGDHSQDTDIIGAHLIDQAISINEDFAYRGVL